MSELSLDALSWNDRQRVLRLHPAIRIQGETPEYRAAVQAAKDAFAKHGLVPIERWKANQTNARAAK